jgi:hypothetical protein
MALPYRIGASQFIRIPAGSGTPLTTDAGPDREVVKLALISSTTPLSLQLRERDVRPYLAGVFQGRKSSNVSP